MIVEIIDQISETPGNPFSLDRAALYGDGFFTTGVIQNHQFSQQSRHFERLRKTAERLLFTNLDLVALQESLKVLLEQTDNAAIRITIFRRQQQRGYSISSNAETVCRILVSKLPILPDKSCELIEAITAISSNPSLAGLKHLNRLDSVLAASEICNTGQEVLMFNGEQVICGSKSNLFVKLNGVWLTPKLDQCGIAGITRARTMEAFTSNNIKCVEARIERSDLAEIEAAFVTNSLISIWPAHSINGRALEINSYKNIRMLVTR